jgi:diphosphomevalonate decarboxylase
MKSTVVAPSNIAFIKYWGKKDEILRLPCNGSISMCTSGLQTTTTVEFDESLTEDAVSINEQEVLDFKKDKVVKHLDRVRKMAGKDIKARISTSNNFPSSTGLSSSASGFAALSLAATKAIGLDLSEKDLSILARQGSGSACRSIPSGFVEWFDGATSQESYAHTIYPADYWDICDVVAVVNQGPKDVSSSVGQESAETSPFFEPRKAHMPAKISEIKGIMAKKDFTLFGELLEAEALELHAIMLTSRPSLIYWEPGTVKLMKFCKQLRKEGLEVYFTINTGQDVHLIVEKGNVNKLLERLTEIPDVRETIVNYPDQGARVVV